MIGANRATAQMMVTSIRNVMKGNSMISGSRGRPMVNGNIRYQFSAGSMISELQEVVDGLRYLQQKNIPAAQEMLNRALTILPFYIEGNPTYNESFDSLLSKLTKVHAWRGKTDKIVELAQKNLRESASKKVILGKEMGRVNVVLSMVQRLDYELNKIERIVQDSYLTAKHETSGAEVRVEDILTAPKQEGVQNGQNLEVWHKVRLEESWLLVVMSLLGKSTLPSNPAFNKFCTTLLKTAEQHSQTNIIKPLTLMVSNLLRTEQYLQAEGMLSYCLDQKREHLSKELLICNQEYALLNLLLAKSYRGVRREEQALKLEQMYRPVFGVEGLMVQGLLLDSI